MIVAPPIERVAAITERLAVLLAGGVTPAAAWGYLAAGARAGRRGATLDDRVLEAATEAADAGGNVAEAIGECARAAATGSARRARASPETDAWLSVAAALDVAISTGAPLAGCLRDLARSQRDLGQAQRDIAAALAGPRATSRLVMVLPVVGLLFGLLLGFDTVGVLFGSLPGLVCLVVSGVLVLAAWRWSAAMVRRSVPASSAPGLAIDLTAIAMSSGVSVARASAAVDAALAAYRPVPRTAAAEERAGIERVLGLSQAAGVPAAELLSGEAGQARRDARSAAQAGAAVLAARLMLPLGLCILPAFMLVGVAPLMMSVLSSTVRGIG